MLRRIPIVGGLIARLLPQPPPDPEIPFHNSTDYWERRYAAGLTSGCGSYSKFAEFKAEVLNTFVSEHSVQTVIEFGCGDGNQLELASYPGYIGFDVSNTAIQSRRQRFAADPTKSFGIVSEYQGEKGDLTLSLDVIYHLVENQVFERYIRTLFAASTRYVIIFSSDSDVNPAGEAVHVRQRKFTKWVEQELPDWSLLQHIPNRYPFVYGLR